MKLLAIACVATVTLTPSAMGEVAGTSADASALIGTWTADCDAWGTEAKCRVDWSSGLHKEQITIAYTIDPAAGGAAIFAGDGVYRKLESGLDGYWSDSGGAIHPLNATWSDSTLTTHWGKAGGEQGRSEYRLDASGTMTVTDWSLTDQGWQQFMQVEYQRQN